MELHTDIRGVQYALEKGIKNFIQIILVMTEKGKDFQKGGAYVIKNNQKIYPENNCLPWDMILYNGSTQHGVDLIDKYTNLDLNSSEGRYVAMVPLFKDISLKELIDFNKSIIK